MEIQITINHIFLLFVKFCCKILDDNDKMKIVENYFFVIVNNDHIIRYQLTLACTSSSYCIKLKLL